MTAVRASVRTPGARNPCTGETVSRCRAVIPTPYTSARGSARSLRPTTGVRRRGSASASSPATPRRVSCGPAQASTRTMTNPPAGTYTQETT